MEGELSISAGSSPGKTDPSRVLQARPVRPCLRRRAPGQTAAGTAAGSADASLPRQGGWKVQIAAGVREYVIETQRQDVCLSYTKTVIDQLQPYLAYSALN